MTRGPQPQRRVALVLVLVAALLPIAPASTVSAASPSDAGHVTTPGGTVDRLVLAATSGPASCTAWASETTPPATIRVYRTRTDTVETLDFRAYMRKVVTGEFKRTWPFELLAMGSIAAKQNAWHWSMRGRDWTNLLTWGGRTHPIQKVQLVSGEYQWQTTTGSVSGAGLCWDLTDNPGIDQCYDCGTTPVDPASAPRNQAALDATWTITLRRPRAGIQSFFAPGYAGRNTATCPSMATQADWESWFTGGIDFNQAYVCATVNGESTAMLLRRFLSSALEIRDPARADLTGDGLGDVPIIRTDPDSGRIAFEPASADPAYVASLGVIPAPTFAAELAPSIVRAVGRLDRADRASMVTLTVDLLGTVAVVARSLDAPGALREVPWWTGGIPELDPTSVLGLSVVDMTGDMRSDVVVIERAPARGPDGLPLAWTLRLWVLVTTDTGASPAGFTAWAQLGPFASPTRFERLGDVDGNGRADLVFAPGDSPQFLVARASRAAAPVLDPAEPYGSVLAPADSAEWRFFALVDGGGSGIDEPIVASIAGGMGLSVQNARATAYPVGWTFAVGPLAPTWSSADPSLASGLLWSGDVDADARADTAIVNATLSTGPILATESGAARLAVVGLRSGSLPTSAPVIAAARLETLSVIAPGSQDLLAANSSLRRLAITVGKLAPDFSTDTTAYTVIVAPTVASIKLRATGVRPWARLTVKGKAIANGALSSAIALKLGVNRIPIVVTDATSRTRYDLTVVKASKPLAPRITKSTTPLGGKLRVYWAPTGTGGSAITSWIVQYRRSGTTKWTTLRVDRSSATNAIIADLPVGKTFDVRVAARNIVGVGAYTPRITLKTR